MQDDTNTEGAIPPAPIAAVSTVPVPTNDAAGQPAVVQMAAVVQFRMIGPALECSLAFENDVQFDPSNLAHLLAWYVQDQVLHMIKPASDLFKTRTKLIADAVAANEAAATSIQTPENGDAGVVR